MPIKHTNKINLDDYGFLKDSEGRLSDAFVFTPNEKKTNDHAQKKDFVEILEDWFHKESLNVDGFLKTTYLEGIVKPEDITAILNGKKVPDDLGICYLSAFVPADHYSRLVFKNRGLSHLNKIRNDDEQNVIVFSEKEINTGKIKYLKEHFELEDATIKQVGEPVITIINAPVNPNIPIKKNREFLEFFRDLMDMFS